MRRVEQEELSGGQLTGWRRKTRNTVLRAAVALALAATGSIPALAGQSPWIDTLGGRLRLVTADQVDAGGILRGALQIRLDPGWKTYWKDPGDSGIAPRIDPGASAGVEEVRILFPAPERITDPYSTWAGYRSDVDLALEMQVDGLPRIAVDVEIGLCETICVPVTARLEVPPVSNADDFAIVDAAFAALPRPAEDGFTLTGLRLAGNRLVAGATLPDGLAGAALFLVTPEGWSLGQPVFEPAPAGGWQFTVPVAERPAGADEVSIEYTLVAGGQAVTGVARLASLRKD